MNILEHVGIENYLTLSALLFCIGAFGLLYRRNAIIMFMSIEIMLNAVNLLFVAFSSYHEDPSGQVFVFFTMAVAAAEGADGFLHLGQHQECCPRQRLAAPGHRQSK